MNEITGKEAGPTGKEKKTEITFTDGMMDEGLDDQEEIKFSSAQDRVLNQIAEK